MSNLLIPSQTSNTKVSSNRQATSFLKLIVFSMGGLNLGLRIESVYKVVNHTPVYSSGLNHVGVAHLGDSLPVPTQGGTRTPAANGNPSAERDNSASREITVVDLYWRFFKTSQGSEFQSDSYLVIVKNKTGELYGIPVGETPVLIEVPLSMIRAIPESYRRADTLEVASHVAVIPQQGTAFTIFLLDVELLLPMFEELRVVED